MRLIDFVYHSTLGLRVIKKKVERPAQSSRMPGSRMSFDTRFMSVSPCQTRENVILLPNNQRQHRTLHIQEDVMPYALC